MRLYFNFMDDSENVRDTTIGQAEQNGTNGISGYLLPVEKSRSQLIQEHEHTVRVYSNILLLDR